jgi:hypothetical protein
MSPHVKDNFVQGTYLSIIMTRQEMKKLVDELDHKQVETQRKIIEELHDELARKLEKLENESSDKRAGPLRRR